MNEKWKKKRTTYYDVFEQLMTPLDRHLVYKDDYAKGISFAQTSLDNYAKLYRRKPRNNLWSSNQPS